MPRGKSKKSEVKKETKKPRSRVVSAPVEAEVKKAPKKVVFEGATVVKVLSSGHTKSAFHCELSNGTTGHVPKNLF